MQNDTMRLTKEKDGGQETARPRLRAAAAAASCCVASRRVASRRATSRRRGSFMVLAALSLSGLLVFCALSADFGRMTATRYRMQHACDAAALAGAQELPENPGRARTVAMNYALANGVRGMKPEDITISDTDNNPATPGDADTKITVISQETVAFGFARVFKRDSGTVHGRAVAVVTPAGSVTGAMDEPDIVPIGITPSTYNAHKIGQTFDINLIRQNKENLGFGEFVLFDLRDSNSKSPSHMARQIHTGAEKLVNIGGTETTLNASEKSQTHHFEKGMQPRLEQAQQAPWNDFGNQYPNVRRDSPRVMTLLITPENAAVNGTNNAPIYGFVAVYLENVEYSSDNVRLRMRILPPTFISDGNGAPAPVNTAITGVRTVRLID